MVISKQTDSVQADSVQADSVQAAAGQSGLVQPPVQVGAQNRQELGALGEQMAAHYLGEQGYHILAKNWRHSTGELDLIVMRGGCLVAVEVKTRRGDSHGRPLEAITPEKQRRLSGLLYAWLRENNVHAQAIRLDGIGILFTASGYEITHVAGISS